MEFDLGIAWVWIHDAPFMDRLVATAATRGERVLQITEGNLETVLRDIGAGRLHLRCFLDRAADEYPEFARLTPALERAGTRVINHVHLQDRSFDKARTHLLFARHGIPVPFTAIAPPFINDPSPPGIPAALGRPFVAKPASGGGCQGVVLDVATVADVQHARRTYWRDRYLLQQRVRPRYLDGRRAWFRVFFVCGLALPCWWDDLTHIYTPLTSEEETRYGLADLRTIVRRIGEVMALDFFTTEIALDADGRLVCVDYANSPCDMRLQSRAHDGVPDGVVDRIIDGLLTCTTGDRRRALEAALASLR